MPDVDADAFLRRAAALDVAGSGVGALSGRAEAQATVAGATRLQDPSGFADGFVGEFEGTVLLAAFVEAVATVLPFFEAAVGLLLLLRLFRQR